MRAATHLIKCAVVYFLVPRLYTLSSRPKTCPGGSGRVLFLDHPGNGYAIHARHHQIHQNNIWLQGFGTHHRLLTILDLADQFQVRDSRDESSQSRTDDGMVVHDLSRFLKAFHIHLDLWNAGQFLIEEVVDHIDHFRPGSFSRAGQLLIRLMTGESVA